MKVQVNVPEGKELLAFTQSYELILLKQGTHNLNVLTVQTPHESHAVFIVKTVIQEQTNIASQVANRRLGERSLQKTLSKFITNLTKEKHEIKKIYQNKLNKENLESYSDEGYKPIYTLRDGILPCKAIEDLEKDDIKTEYIQLEEGKEILNIINFLYKAFVKDKIAFKESETGEYDQNLVSYNAMILFNVQAISDLLVPLLVLETNNCKMTSYYESCQEKLEEVNKAIFEYIDHNYYMAEKRESFLDKMKNKFM